MSYFYDKRVSVAILDDHYIVLHGLSEILSHQPQFNINGTFTSSRELLASMSRTPADVVLVDFQLAPSDLDGLNLISTIHRKYPETAILVISSHYNPATVALALRGGAKGFIGKNRPPQELERAITEVSKGRIFIEPEMAEVMASQSQNGRVLLAGRMNENTVKTAISLSSLSPKEQEVIRCFLNGMTVTDISAKFNRSKKTVSGQKNSAMRKLGIRADHELYIIKDELLKSIDS